MIEITIYLAQCLAHSLALLWKEKMHL